MKNTASSAAFVLMCLLMVPATGFSQQPVVYKTIHEAAENGDLADVKRHLKNGVDVNTRDKNGSAPLNHVTTFAFFAFGSNLPSSYLKTIEFLVANGADVNNKDNQGGTLLMSNRNLYLLKLFVEHGADVNAKDKDGFTPLMGAAIRGQLEEIKYLVANGADVNAKNKDGMTPLLWAKRHGERDATEFLKQHGAKE